MAETYRITRAIWEKHQAQLAAVRFTVFVDEQKVPREEELDGKDPQCAHVAALDSKGATVGTGRMMANGHIGRMAVLAPWRGRGVGTALIQELIAIAKERGLAEVDLDAQVRAIPFYERLGFAVVSDIFMDAGIPHKRMVLAL